MFSLATAILSFLKLFNAQSGIRTKNPKRYKINVGLEIYRNVIIIIRRALELAYRCAIVPKVLNRLVSPFIIHVIKHVNCELRGIEWKI